MFWVFDKLNSIPHEAGIKMAFLILGSFGLVVGHRTSNDYGISSATEMELSLILYGWS